MQSDAETLYRVLCCSYSHSAEERSQAEAFLKAAERTPGFPISLIRVAAEPRVDTHVRAAAAIQFKTQVKKWWAPAGEHFGKGYGDADKAAVRSVLLDATASVSSVPGVQLQLVEAFRCIAAKDFPIGWPSLPNDLYGLLTSDDTSKTHAALLLLRRLFKQLEGRPTSRRSDLDDLSAKILPALRTLGPAMIAAVKQQNPNCANGAEMLKLLLKCLSSSTYTGLCQAFQQDVDAWMSVLSATLGLPLPGQGSGEACALSKCRKWVFHIILRFCIRHGNTRRCPNGAEPFAQMWSEKYAVPIMEACVHEASLVTPCGTRAPKRSVSLALLSLGILVAQDKTYAALMPNLQSLLEKGVFPWACFGQDDAKLWQEDPEEFIRQSYDDFTHFHDPRGAAMEFVSKLLDHRESDVLLPLLQFCRQHLDKYVQNPANLELAAGKDGALLLLGSMSSAVLSLDPARVKKKKAKTSAPQSAVSVEELLSNYVQPELCSQNTFLRFRAVWVYEQFASKIPRFGQPGTGRNVCNSVIQLMSDPEVIIRVRASTCLKSFIGRSQDQEVKEAILGNVGSLLERLLKTIAEIQSEHVAHTMEALVEEYPDQVVPYAAQLVVYLAAQVCQSQSASEGADDDDDDEAEGLAMGSMATIISILQACVGQPDQDEAAMQRRALLFASIGESLLPLLSRLLSPSGIDFLEEGLDILSYILRYGPSPIPPVLMQIFPRLYQAVCGHSTASMPLPEPLRGGWAPDYMPNMLPSIDNFITRGPPEAFLASVWTETGAQFPEMLFQMFKKVLHLPGLGSESDCEHAARLGTVVFASAPAPQADVWMPRYFEELRLRLPKVETKQLRKAIFTAFATMMWYNTLLFLQCAEEKQCTQQLFQEWMKECSLPRTLADRKIFVLAFQKLLTMCWTQTLPACISAGMPHVAQQLLAQSREVIKIRARRQSADDEDDDDDEDSLDDEEALNGVLQKLQDTEDPADAESFEDTDDDDDECARVTPQNFSAGKLSRLQQIDEIRLLADTLRSAGPHIHQQIQGWSGTAVPQWISELDAEVARSSNNN